MAGYKPGIPTQPYTKWDAEKDEVEVDYKRLDPSGRTCFSGRKGCVLKVRGEGAVRVVCVWGGGRVEAVGRRGEM